MREDTAANAKDWVFVARSVVSLPDSRSQALHCMARATLTAQSAEDWVLVATTWAREFGDMEAARRSMARAEEDVDDSYAWIWVAEVWHGELGDQEAVTRCLGEAEEAAEDSDHWVQIAKAWMEVLQDPDAARRCLGEIEDAAEDSDECIQVAKAWMEVLQDPDAAVRCMEKAQDVAYELSEFEAIEEAWREGIPGLSDSLRNSGIQRVLDNPDVEGYIDTFQAAVSDSSSRQQATVIDLGNLNRSSTSQTGVWNDECISERQEGSYARYYSFTLTQSAVVTVDLKSDIDTYLYLVDGDPCSGEVLDEDDDGGEVTDSHIVRSLAAGTYGLEATTYDQEEVGTFILEISLGVAL